MNWRRYHWLDDGVLPLLVATIRVCWIWPWLQLLQRWLTPAVPHPWVPLWSIPIFLLSAAFLARQALARTKSLRRARLMVVAIGLVAILVLLWWQYYRGTLALWDWQWLWRVGYALSHPDVDPLPMFTVLVGVGLWLRGVLDGRYTLTHDAIWRAFTMAFVAMGLLLLVVQLDPRGLPSNTGRWLLLLIASGLSALALSSLQLSSITGRWETGRETQLPLNRYWLASVGVVIGVMLLVGLAVGAVVSPATVAHAFGWVAVVLEWIGILIGYVFMAFAYVLFLFLTPLYEWLRGRMANAELPEPPNAEGMREQFDPLANSPGSTIPPLVEETARWSGLLVVIIIAGVIIALALRYFRRRDAADPEETRETIFTTSLLEAQLASLWQQFVDRLRRVTQEPGNPFLSLADEQENRRAIRAGYQSLLALAQAQGYPRARAQTPGEYVARLAVQFPATRSAWDTVTEEYVAARYGLQAPTQAQVERMRQACDVILRALGGDAAGAAASPARRDRSSPS